jgi:Amino acid transporters
MSNSENTMVVENMDSGLKKQCLTFWEVLGQSVANIAPSATPAFTIPIVFAAAGNGTWVAYLFATIAIVFLSMEISVFSRRVATPGALYTYVTVGCGGTAGFVSGSGLAFAYLMMGSAELCAFSIYGNNLLGFVGLKLPPLLLVFICWILAWLVNYKGVQISTKLLLIIEAVSLSLILVLGIIVMVQHNFQFGAEQFEMKGVSFGNMRFGLVMAFFSFIGFESATALGHEAKNPLKNIPRAVTGSGIISGVFFILMSLIMVMGFVGSKTSLGNSTAPFTYLSNQAHVGIFGILIACGATISMWSCCVASIQAASRMMLTMSKNGELPEIVGRTHKKNSTPHVAIAICAVIIAVPLIFLLFKSNIIDIYNWTITLCVFGFLLSYILISIGGPIFLAKEKSLTAGAIVTSVISLILLIIPLIGSIYPIPAYPLNLLPYIFLVWLAVSLLWYLRVKRKKAAQQIAGNSAGEEPKD